MAKQTIDLGTLGGADGTGDSIRTAGAKINSNFTEIYANSAMSSQISVEGNNIKTTQSNADLFLSGSGTGVVAIPTITIDSNINITDNIIKALQSDSNIEFEGAGTGSVQIAKTDINSGEIDNTVIGGSTPAAATFTTLSATTLNADGITITDNTITSTSNADVEISGNGTGTTSINGLKMPSTDGTPHFLIKTDGSGNLSFDSTPILLDLTTIDDSTATLTAGSSYQTIDSWDLSTYRSAKYHIQISDATADRYRLIDATVTHDGSNAYVSVFGGVDNGDGDGSTVYDTMDINAIVAGGNIALQGRLNNTNNHVIKFVRRLIKV